ncbi:MAG: tripartite tricarboxylate transporter substrate-binding protein, partial [Pseudomonadota bacterium]
VVFNGLTSALPFIKTAKLRALGMTSLNRSIALPSVPTLDESGLKGFQAVAWNGLTAPARTPKNVVDKINADVQKVMRSPELIEKLKAEGSDAVGNSPELYARFLREELAKWAKVIKFANITGL